MENEPVEKSLLHHLPFRIRMKWLQQNTEHLRDVMDTQSELHFDYQKAVRDLNDKQPIERKSNQSRL